MATQSLPERRMTAAEYVAFELAAATRHEFHDGRVYAMSGASRAHNTIALNIASRLLAGAIGTPCRVFLEGMRLALPSGPHYYPDVTVVCEPPPDDAYIETSPCVIVEVLSPSTKRLDVGHKLPRYQASPSVQAVLLVSQDAPIVEVRRRNDASGGFTVDYVLGQGTVPFACPGLPGGPVAMTLDEIYRGAEPPPGSEIAVSDPTPPAR